MIKQYVNSAFVIFAAWTVYAYCQQDWLLPTAMAAVFVLTLMARLNDPQKHFPAADKVPLSVVIIISMLIGFFWRSVHPAPEDASSPFPQFTAAFQAAMIVAALFFWLKPLRSANLHILSLLAWATVASSIDVPLSPNRLLVFCSFCVTATVFVVPETLRKPKEKKRLFVFYRDYIFFSVLMVGLTVGLFLGIAKTLVAFDEAFMNLASDYMIPRNYTNFLRIDSKLQLTSPGRSAWDKRPVLEVAALPGFQGIYLKMQIFKDFNNGTWEEIEKKPLTPLPGILNKNMPTIKLTMFTPLEKILPAPTGVAAVQGVGSFVKSRVGIVYAENKQNTRMLEFSIDPKIPPVELSPQEQEQYTQLPAGIADRLKEISAGIVGTETDPALKAQLIRNFFLKNFQYSLSVNFRANDEGILKMIEERRPAYCSYFATAATLLLRAEGIPARVTTGFHTTELIDRRENKFLVRVYDAHAWSEVLMERTDPVTGRKEFIWRGIDPTPAGQRDAALADMGVNISVMLEKIWLGSLRLEAFIENLDKEKLKRGMLWALIAVMIMLNRRPIAGIIHQWLGRLKQRPPPVYFKNDRTFTVYRRYEDYLKNAWNETRQLTETDADLLRRLRSRQVARLETLSEIEDFIRQYHAARFGGKAEIDLEAAFGHIGRTEKNKP